MRGGLRTEQRRSDGVHLLEDAVPGQQGEVSPDGLLDRRQQTAVQLLLRWTVAGHHGDADAPGLLRTEEAVRGRGQRAGAGGGRGPGQTSSKAALVRPQSLRLPAASPPLVFLAGAFFCFGAILCPQTQKRDESQDFNHSSKLQTTNDQPHLTSGFLLQLLKVVGGWRRPADDQKSLTFETSNVQVSLFL